MQSNFGNIETSSSLYKFIIEGIKYIKNKEICSNIFLYVITNRNKNLDFCINITYYLHNSKSGININKKITVAIDSFINTLAKNKELILAVNIKDLLTKEHLLQLNSIMPKIVDSNTDYQAIISLSYIVNGTTSINNFQDIISKHTSLWNNGISDSWKTSPIFLPLRKLNKKIIFTEPYLLHIYNRLIISFNQFVINKSKCDSYIDYFDLLQEMYLFLNQYSTKLSNYNDYNKILNNIKSELENNRKFSCISEGLLSDEKDVIIKTLNTLIAEINKNNLNDYKDEIVLLLDRIIFKKKEALQECLYCASSYLKLINVNDLNRIYDRYQKILNVYNSTILYTMNCNVYECSNYLIHIAELLKKIDLNSDDVERWLKLKKKHRYNF